MTDRFRQLTLRLNDSEWRTLDQACTALGRTRSEVARAALANGLPLVRAGHSIDLRRLITLIEHTQACIDVIINREHADAATQLIELALQRVEEFHPEHRP